MFLEFKPFLATLVGTCIFLTIFDHDAVSLCCILCIHETEGAGDKEPDVDLRVRGTESEVPDS